MTQGYAGFNVAPIFWRIITLPFLRHREDVVAGRGCSGEEVVADPLGDYVNTPDFVR